MVQNKADRKAAFRKELARRWTEWLATDGRVLRSVGLPDEILSDEEHWSDFCTHACLHMHPSKTRFTVDDIPDAEAKRLLEFLHKHLTQEEKWYAGLFLNLRRRFEPNDDD